jgi:predicted TPR repeat methyltransferase
MEQTATTDRALRLDEAVAIAIEMQKSEQWAAASDVYRRVLDVAPDYADALHFSGVLAHQMGRSEEAVRLIEKSVELEAERADWYSNLGIVFRDRLELDKAAAALRRAIAINPDHANAHSNLGVVLRAQGQLAESEEAYRTAIRLEPGHVDAYTNLGLLLSGQHRTHEAVMCFCKVITLRPKHPDAKRLLALAHCAIGEVDKAVEIFEQWARDEPANPIAAHMLAACSGRDVPARASDGFIQQTFDSFAASFDAKLAKLLYRAPQLVAAVLEDCAGEPGKSLDILDAGCGTGLCGPLVAAFARRLVGVDLSGRMLAQAEQRHVYDQLVKGELTGYLRDAHDAFDVIVSADTLVYFGPLHDVITAAAGALRPGGRLIFTVEALTGPGTDPGYVISPHGRYGHRQEYIESVLGAADLGCEIRHADLRIEAGDPVAGLVVRATKPASVGMSHA